jgi:hypothetical protein
MKNEIANSQTKTAIGSKTSEQVKGKTSSKKYVAPESANKAIAQAQKNGAYLYMLFYEKKDNSFQEMQKSVQAFSKNSTKTIKTYEAMTTDSKESDVIQKYGINRTPLPLLLVFAPNGAITGGFPQKVTEEQLSNCMVPKLIMNILKSVQAGKVALVLLQNDNTTFNKEVAKVADEFSKDARVLGYVDIIRQDPTDGNIKDFLTQCKIENTMKEATTVLIVPPNKIGGVYSGKITKETLITGIASCSGGGCCPK